jgi:hypothetical protein
VDIENMISIIMMVHQKLPCELLVRLLLRPGRLHHSCCAATYYSPPPCRSKEYGKAKKQCITVYHASREKGIVGLQIGKGKVAAVEIAINPARRKGSILDINDDAPEASS